MHPKKNINDYILNLVLLSSKIIEENNKIMFNLNLFIIKNILLNNKKENKYFIQVK
jgi:hypothetical protein